MRLLVTLLMAVFVSGVAKAKVNQTSKQKPQIKLYAEASDQSKLITTLSPQQRLVPIFHQDGWTRVGNPDNGQVGWVNNKQYRQALASWYQPDVQTVYLQSSQDGDKPQVTVVAYRNGEQLDDKEARALYQQIRQQNLQQQMAMQRFKQRMDRLFSRQLRMLYDDFGWFDGPDWSFTPPVIVINQPPASQNNSK